MHKKHNIPNISMVVIMSDTNTGELKKKNGVCGFICPFVLRCLFLVPPSFGAKERLRFISVAIP